MAHYELHGNGRLIKGASFGHLHLGKAARALLAAELVNGAATLVHPTIAQASTLAGVSPAYTALALQITQDELAARVRAGTLSLVVAAQQAKPVQPPSPVTEPEIDDLIAAAGVAKVWDSLCAEITHARRFISGAPRFS